MGTTRFIWYKGFQNLLLIYPVYPLLFSEAGMSLSQISFLLAIWSIPVVVFELPSGLLADQWNRKNSLILAGVFRMLCFFLWMLPASFFIFAMGFLAWGTAEAFSSGAEEALLFDSLKISGRQEQFEAVYGKGAGVASIAVALSCITGGYVAHHAGFSVVLALSLLCSLVATILVIGCKEVNLYRERQPRKDRSSLHVLQEAFTHITKRRSVALMVALLVIPISMMGILDEYDPLVASSYGLLATSIGLWTGGRHVLESLGAFSARFFGGRHANTPVLLCVLGGFVLLLYSLFLQKVFLPLYFLFYLFLAAAGIIQENQIQQSIEDQGRSTIHSFTSLVTDLHALMIFLMLGFIQNLSNVILLVAAYILVSALSILNAKMKNGAATKQPHTEVYYPDI